jgi:hypothetical protein
MILTFYLLVISRWLIPVTRGSFVTNGLELVDSHGLGKDVDGSIVQIERLKVSGVFGQAFGDNLIIAQSEHFTDFLASERFRVK